jgi:hypothetical protein
MASLYLMDITTLAYYIAASDPHSGDLLHALTISSCGQTQCQQNKPTHAINDLVWRTLGRANIPAVEEPAGLVRSDGKRPDSLTQIPRHAGKCRTWHVTVTDTLAESHLSEASPHEGSIADCAANGKEPKYQSLACSVKNA